MDHKNIKFVTSYGDKMEIKKTASGFEETIGGREIHKIVFDTEGNCKVVFNDKSNQTFQTECSVYNIQYGIPVSDDEKQLFVGSWEKGLFAYEIHSGSLLWWCRSKRIRELFLFDDYIIAVKANEAILKIDIKTGEILDRIKSRTIESAFYLSGNCIAVDRIKGFISIVNTAALKEMFHFQNNTINPNRCLSLLIREMSIVGDQLLIQGVEEYPDGNTAAPGKAFRRFVPFPKEWEYCQREE